MAEIVYKTGSPTEFTQAEKATFRDLLIKQGKVRNPTVQKVERCVWLCVCKVDGQIVSIGAIKPATKSDFDKDHAQLEKLAKDFTLELGYCFTEPDHTRKGYSSTVVNFLLENQKTNLIASTELRNDNGMIYVLQKFGFKQYGKPWKSVIHGGLLGLYLRIIK